ncbi:MAG: hypothetical protein ACPHER_03185 [Nevskiales bacterium]
MNPNHTRRQLQRWLLALCIPALTACGGGGSDDPDVIIPTAEYAVATVSDFITGGHVIGSATEPREFSDTLDPGDGDIAIATNGAHFYRIGRVGIDSISKYSALEPQSPIWTFSTLGDDASSNPYDIIFASETKAYVLRYNTGKVWIVDPSVSSEAEFKIGELDLSHYDSDGTPQMHAAVIVGDKLFIAMQRLEQGAFAESEAVKQAYLAVFDTNTDTEIETNADLTDSLKGIPLTVRNTYNMVYDPDSGSIYLAAAGSFPCGFCDPATPAEYTGGIVRVDPESYAVAMIVDDDADTENPYGNLTNLAVVSASQGYFIGSASFGSNTLYRFNPSTGEVAADPVAGLADLDISCMGVDSEAYLWICKGDFNTPGMIVLDAISEEISEEVATMLNPTDIAFGEVAITEEVEEEITEALE